MPRTARQKTNDSTYHIMCKSISEVKLFRSNDDKQKYIEILKSYQKIHKFRILCYCFMGNHVHLIADANGADVSQFMHGINFSYAKYYNKKYDRHGHLFQDRFRSKIIDSERYLMTASAYIHNNPTDIQRYQTCPEEFLFSSLSIYLGFRKDPFGLVDTDSILQLFGDDLKSSREKYYEFVMKCDRKELKEFEFENERALYKNQRTVLVRECSTEKIMDYVTDVMRIPRVFLHVKSKSEGKEAKALSIMLMKTFCNFNSREICAALGNITQTYVSKLMHMGMELCRTDEKFNSDFEGFVKFCV